MVEFNKQHIAPNQQKYVLDALEKGELGGDGFYSKKAVEKLSSILGHGRVLLTPSASHALELAFWRLDASDEVIIPAYNFPSAANAVLRAGGRVVLCDIDPETQNLDPEKAAELVTPNTKAICLTHYAGIACDMDAFKALAKQHGIILVEDAAHAIGSFYKGKPLGSIGESGCYSFHATKNISCGEGGAFVYNGGQNGFDTAAIRRDNGTNRAEFLKRNVPFYAWEDIGTSHLMPELCAAMLFAQLEEMENISRARLNLCAEYREGLAPLFAREALFAMGVPEYAQGNGHIYYVRFDSEGQRDTAKDALAEKGIMAQTHFVPLHMGGMGARLGYKKGQFPHSEKTAETLLRLPVHTALGGRCVEEICDVIAGCFL